MFKNQNICNIEERFTIMPKPKIKPSDIEQDNSGYNKNLVLFNDNINTFEFVISTLIEVCHHEPHQAEQCALTAHYKGKCTIKTGDFHLLKPISDTLSDRNLTVTIE